MINVKILVIISLGCLLQFSCKKRSVKDIIDDGSYRYWRYNQTEKCDDLYYFDDEGNWTIFEGCRDVRFTKYVDFKEYDGGDNLLERTWELVNDSIIIFDGHHYKVSILKDTVIVLKYTHRNDSRYNRIDTLHVVPTKMIPLEYRKKLFFKKYKEVYV